MLQTDLIALVSLPVVSACIGWLTNKVALLMLFRPREGRKFGPLMVQGMVPRRQKDIAAAVADTVSKHLVTGEAIRDELLSPEAKTPPSMGL